MATLTLTAADLRGTERDTHPLSILAAEHIEWWRHCHSIELEISSVTFRGYVPREGLRVVVDDDGFPVERDPVTVGV